MKLIACALMMTVLGLSACGGDDRSRQPAARAPAPVATAPATLPVAPGPSTRNSVVNASTANLRERASNSARRIAVLQRGTEVEVIEIAGTWARVRAGGEEGYVLAQSLRPE
jgi:uncharacterized protein YgiM (DUF1202 family)